MADYTIKSVAKAAQVIRVLGQSPRPATLTEISKTTKLPKNVVFRILNTLQDEGFAGRTEDKWYLGHNLIVLVHEQAERIIEKAIKPRSEDSVSSKS